MDFLRPAVAQFILAASSKTPNAADRLSFRLTRCPNRQLIVIVIVIGPLTNKIYRETFFAYPVEHAFIISIDPTLINTVFGTRSPESETPGRRMGP